MTTDNTHAIANARGWLETIREMVTTLRDAPNEEAREAAQEAIQTAPLSIQIRDGWRNPGAESTPHEYEILLSTGGPALRIVGDLNDYCEPASATLQWQDWFVPWTDYADATTADDAVLTAFASVFYFGEG